MRCERVMINNKTGVMLLEFLRRINEMEETPESGHVDELLELIGQEQVEVKQPVGFRVLVNKEDEDACSLAKKLSNSKDGELIMMETGEMIAMTDPHRVFVLRSD